MPSKAKSLLQKIKRRTWMKFALRSVGGNDNFERPSIDACKPSNA